MRSADFTAGLYFKVVETNTSCSPFTLKDLRQRPLEGFYCETLADACSCTAPTATCLMTLFSVSERGREKRVTSCSPLSAKRQISRVTARLQARRKQITGAVTDVKLDYRKVSLPSSAVRLLLSASLTNSTPVAMTIKRTPVAVQLH